MINPPIALTGDPLDRCDALRKQPGKVEQLQNHLDAIFIVLLGDEILIGDDQTLAVVNNSILPQIILSETGLLFLGVEPQTKRPWFVISAQENVPENQELLQTIGRFVPPREALRFLPPSDLALAGRALSLKNWHQNNRFCACCGTLTISTAGGEKRECISCEREYFPRVDPAVIMMVVKDDACLLGRNASWPAGVYSTLAGFVEPGESLEEACRREVMEEVGIKVGDVSYAFSQPWPFPHSMMIALVAQALSSKITLEDELEDARWFSRKEALAIVNGTHDQVTQPFSRASSGVLLRNWVLKK